MISIAYLEYADTFFIFDMIETSPFLGEAVELSYLQRYALGKGNIFKIGRNSATDNLNIFRTGPQSSDC